VRVHSSNPSNAYGIAADPRVIPYGTNIYIKEYDDMLQNNKNFVPSNVASVDDTGGAMRQFKPQWRDVGGETVIIEIHLDVRFRLEKTATKWGVKYLQVFIYD
jgi:3D (Asp-Asp-Asp) domain-containing protein